MFKVKNMDETWDLEDGRKTKILFGLNKPYPPKASIKKIRVLFYYLMSKYPQINIEMLCDSSSVEENIDENTVAMYCYNDKDTGKIVINSDKWGEMSHFNMFGKGGIPDDVLIKKWDLEDICPKNHLQYVFIHEFAHAIETQLELYKNDEIIYIYNKYKMQHDFDEDISEFIAHCFVTSMVAENDEAANSVKKIIEKIIKNK